MAKATGIRFSAPSAQLSIDAGCIENPQGTLTCSGPVKGQMKYSYTCSQDGDYSWKCTSAQLPDTLYCTLVDGINSQYNIKCKKNRAVRSYQGTPAAGAPGIVSPVSVANNQVNLAWTLPNGQGGTLTGYTISRATVASGTPGTPANIGTVGPTTTSFSDTNVTNGTTYQYIVTPSYSDSTPVVPSAPANVTPFSAPVVTISKNAISQPVLTWTAPSGVTGLTYNVYRDGSMTALKTNVTSPFTDTSSLTKGTHTYTVQANLPASSSVSAEVATSAPVTVTETTSSFWVWILVALFILIAILIIAAIVYFLSR